MSDLVKVVPSEARIGPARAYIASLAPSGRRSMESALRAVLDVAAPGVAVDEFPWERLRAEHTAAIRARIVEKYAPRTSNRILAAVRGVLKVCWRQQLISDTDYHHAIDMKSVTVSGHVRAGRRITLDEARALITAAEADPERGAHDAALIITLFYGGLRRAEVCALDTTDYTPGAGAILVREGKGGKQREVFLTPKAQARFEAWWDTLPIDPDTPIFRYIGKRGIGGRLPVDEVGDLLARIGKAARVAPFTAHDFRRTFATTLLANGVDIATVQNAMGHSNIATTALYDRRGVEAVKEAVNKMPDL